MWRSDCLGLLLTAAVAAAVACGDSGTENAPNADTAGSGASAVDLHARALATSGSHTCALRKSGVYCWGANEQGQLGDESATGSATPVKAKVEASDAVEIAVHTGYSCIRRRSGKVACWGANDSGQLGDGTQSAARTAVAAAVSDVKQLALDEKSGCALRADASVWCWGGSADSLNEPKQVAGIEAALDVHSGSMNTYCARGEGFTRCWHLEGGQWTTPTDVSALANASKIALASAQEVCGVVADEVVCQDLAGGASVRLQGSAGTSQLVGGLHTLCGGDNVGAWYRWDILSAAVLQTIGAARRELSRGPFRELTTAGYRYCGLNSASEVQCMEINAPSPQFAVVTELPE